MKRRDFLRCGALAGAGALAWPWAARAHGAQPGPLAPPAGSPTPQPPDIVLILTDQQVFDAVGALAATFSDPAYLAHYVHTPNLDRLMQAGTAFTEHHVVNPVCSPSRACLFTGRMSIETSVIGNNVGIDARLPNLGQWLERSGSPHRRYYCGKWHASGPWNNPQVEGPHVVPGFETLPSGDGPTGDLMDPQVAASVEAFLRGDHDERPYLLVAGFMNPHDIAYWYSHDTAPPGDVFGLKPQWPPLPPSFNAVEEAPMPLDRPGFQGEQWRAYLYDYARMVEMMDAQVGRVLDAIEARNRPTLVVFTSDHGEGLARNQLVSKWTPYQHSFKTPLIVAGPGIAAGVIDTTHLVSSVDLSATLCDYAGMPPIEGAHGLSLRPLLTGQAPAHWRDHIYGELRHTGRIIRTQRHKLVMGYQYSGVFEKPFVTKNGGQPAQFVPGRGADFAEHPIRMLFDLEADPWETVNRARDPGHATLVAEHLERLREWEAKLTIGEPHTVN